MNILIIGSGGREHALAWKVAQSPQVKDVWVAPGNAGTALEAGVKNVDIEATDIQALREFAQANNIDLTIVGNEAPLAAGIVDIFNAANLTCLGPTQAAAQLESSKAFSKNFMSEHKIPTASYGVFTDAESAKNYLAQQTFPIVLKADGLAQGKGVVIANDMTEAENAINQWMDKGHSMVIEQYIQGEELSYIVLTDGVNILPLASSQDHKRLLEGEQGPNTGGMGAYSPAPLLTPTLERKILQQIIQPTLDGMRAANTPYVGFLYAGLMITPDYEPIVLEFNCRLGDPETQVLMMRLKSDLVALCLATLAGKLKQTSAEWTSEHAVTVVMAANGYPDHYRSGEVIQGLDTIKESNIKVFHNGTAQQNEAIVTNGGRVLSVTAVNETILDAKQNAYSAVRRIHWPQVIYRSDIGARALAKTRALAPVLTQAVKESMAVNRLVASCLPLMNSVLTDAAPVPNTTRELIQKINYEVQLLQNEWRRFNYRTHVIQAATYLLCSFVDLQLHHNRWVEPQWPAHQIRDHFHPQNIDEERFFTILDRTLEDSETHIDLLELGYLCLSLTAQPFTADTPEHDSARMLDNLYEAIREARGEISKSLAVETNQHTLSLKPRRWWHAKIAVSLFIIGSVSLYIPYHWQLAQVAGPVQQSVNHINLISVTG